MASIQWHLLQSFAAELFFFSMSLVAMLEHSVEMYINLPKYIWNLISYFLHVILNYVNWNNSLYLLHGTIKVPVYLKNTYPTVFWKMSHIMKWNFFELTYNFYLFHFFLSSSLSEFGESEGISLWYDFIGMILWFYSKPTGVDLI